MSSSLRAPTLQQRILEVEAAITKLETVTVNVVDSRDLKQLRENLAFLTRNRRYADSHLKPSENISLHKITVRDWLSSSLPLKTKLWKAFPASRRNKILGG